MMRNIAKHGRLIEVARTIDRVAAKLGDRSVGNGGLHQAVHVLHCLGGDHRAAVDAFGHAITDVDLGHGGSELGGELTRDVGVRIEPVGSGARLGAVAHLGHHGTFDGGIEIGVVEHDEGRIATKLHHCLQHAIGRATKQQAADRGRTGERHHARRLVIDSRIEPATRIARRNHIDQAGRNASFLAQLGDPQRGKRRLGGRLDDDRVASTERRRQLAGDHGRREVPWRDHHDHAHRRVLHDDALVATGRHADRSVDAHRLFSVPPEELSRVRDLTNSIRARFAVLFHDQVGKLVGVLDQRLPARPQDLGAHPRCGRGPARLSRCCGIDRGTSIGGRSTRDVTDQVAGCRIEHLDAFTVLACAPLATDKQVCLHNISPRIG